MAEVHAFPWDELERTERRRVRASRHVRRALGPVSPEALCSAAGTLLTADVLLTARRHSMRPRGEAFSEDGVAVDLVSGEGVAIALWMEAPLADAALSRLLGRPAMIASTDAGFGETLRGALTALAVETLRHAGCTTAPQPSSAPPAATPGAVLRGTLMLDGVPYRVAGWAAATDPDARARAPVRLEDLGSLPIRATIVGAHAAIDRAELAALEPGNVLVPARWLAGLGTRHGAIGVDSGILHLSPGASDVYWVLRAGNNDRLALTADVASADAEGQTLGSHMNEPDDPLADALLATPVVVQVEIGTVTLPAREWATLGPGDVLETGVRLGEQAVLRVAGLEVARGELVSVDGKVGVRIERITTAGRDVTESD